MYNILFDQVTGNSYLWTPNMFDFKVMEGLIEQLRNANRMREARGQVQKVSYYTWVEELSLPNQMYILKRLHAIFVTLKCHPLHIQGHKEYYQGELELNARLRTFSVNCSLLYGGHNTVQAQLKYKLKRGQYSVLISFPRSNWHWSINHLTT